MNSSLRERRRRETSREIQTAAVELALELGYDALTTDLISQRAGISTRTFFNYFPNKTAALAGDPPRFDGAHVEAFIHGTGRLCDDLKILMRDQLRQILIDPAAVDRYTRLLQAEPRLRDQHDAILDGLRQDLAKIIATRLPGCATLSAPFMAQMLIGFLKIVIEDWAAQPDQTLEHRFETIWPQFLDALHAITA